jgi:hypothetical protein
MKSICFIWTKPFDFLGAVSNFCLNTKIIIFPLHHGESKLHLNDMMMSALYYNTLHHGESKLHLNDMMMSALYYNTYIMVRASYISMIWWCLLCTTTHYIMVRASYISMIWWCLLCTTTHTSWREQVTFKGYDDVCFVLQHIHHGESKLHFNDMMMSVLYYNTFSC